MCARRLWPIALSLFVVIAVLQSSSQDLSPRAYVITPLNSNAVTLTWSFYDGGVDLNGTIPVTGLTGAYHVPSIAYYRSLGFFGRSANITVFLPYGVGTFQGQVFGTQRSRNSLGPRKWHLSGKRRPLQPSQSCARC